MSRTQRNLRLLLGTLLIGLGLAISVPVVLDLASKRIAAELEERLSVVMGGRCRIGSAQLLSLHDVAIQELACVVDSGPLLGIASRTFSANFEGRLTSGKLSPIRALAVDGLELRLRELPALPTRSIDAPPQEPGEGKLEEDPGTAASATEKLESIMLRFLDLSQAISQGRGGGRVAGLRDRLASSSTVRVDHASMNGPDGEVLLRNLHGQLSRKGEQLGLALALDLARGGIVSLDGTLTQSGLEGARVRLERVPIADRLNSVLGERLSVREALLSASLHHIRWAGEQSWQMAADLKELTAGEGMLGEHFVTLPPLHFEAKLVGSPGSARLSLEDGRWEVAGIGGDLRGEIGPLGGEEPVRFKVSSEALRLPLGKLLGSLPEQVMPSTWSEEIKGTMDMNMNISGPLHQRAKWSLDWNGDFSRMVLVSGELADHVERLQGPFEHSFQGRVAGDKPVARLVGGQDPHFVPLRRISSHLVNAVVSTEDAGFFGHSGFSAYELKEAMLENLREGGGRGGSTITQQLAKNLFLSGERTLARKLKEAIIAWRLESDLPKERILEIYLNIAEWGPGLYGIRDAADHYFGRSPRVLRPEEAAFLASLLPSPRRYHGYYHERGVTRNRQALVQDILQTMHRMGRLQRRAFLLALDEPIEMIPCSW